jgi:hypothetical protein
MQSLLRLKAGVVWYYSLKKIQIEDSKNLMKIEELVSSGCLKKLLKNRDQQENL